MKCLLIGCLLVPLTMSLSRGQEAEDLRIPFTNPAYQEGDWLSYSTFRFVNGLAIGPREVYFATTGGILRYNHFRNVWEVPWTVSDGLPGTAVTSVAYDADTDMVWCATDVGVSYRNPTSARWVNFYKEDFGIPLRDPIVSIGVSPSAVFFESERGNDARADKYGSQVVPLSGSYPNDNILWFGARANSQQDFPMFHMGQGLFFDPEGAIRDFRLREFPITCSQEDPWSTLWVGTWGMGAGKADLRMGRLEMLPIGLWEDEVRALAETDDELWIAGFGKYESEWGLTVWNRTSDEWRYYESRYTTRFPSDRVLAIAAVGPRIWLATDLGLVLFDRSKNTWRTFDAPRYLDDNWVYDVLADGEWVWASTRQGVVRIQLVEGEKDSVTVERLDPDNLRGVEAYDLEKTANLLWVGSSEGLYVYDLFEARGGFVQDKGGPVGAPVTAVGAWKDTLWVGSWNGVEALDMAHKKWLPPPAGRIETDATIHMIRSNGRTVWAATDTGVLKYDVGRHRWRTFTVEDGLIGSRVYSILLDGDYAWFGTNRGLTRFYWNNPYRVD